MKQQYKNQLILYFFQLTCILSIFLMGGCASWSPALSKDELPTDNDAYIYGKFHIKAPRSFLGMDGHQTMGFVFKCSEDEQCVIRFNKKDPIQLIKVYPSIYSFEEIIYTDADGTIRSRKPAPKGVLDDINLKAGLACYIGDYYAISQNTVSYNYTHTTWKIKDIRDAYIETTKQMKSLYPNFENIQTVNVLR